MVASAGPVAVRVPGVMGLLSYLNLGLHARTRDRAHHGSSERAPEREQHCKQQDEPETE